jgi:dienelactone hydrolase
MTTTGLEQPVRVETDSVTLEGNLDVPQGARGVVLFAHGSGSSRHSPRNRFVARKLHETGLATLLIDLLTPDEEAEDQFTGRLRFDMGLLGKRLLDAADWLFQNPGTDGLPLGLFGASTGAAAALIAAAARPESIGAVVSRGGRPDLAGPALAHVEAPTLLIVGGNDTPVLRLNRQALTQLKVREKQLAVVPGATHLFEEPGALEEVARLAAAWFLEHLAPTGASSTANSPMQ